MGSSNNLSNAFSDPLRGLLAVTTLGTSEGVLGAKNQFMDEPANQAKSAAKKVADQAQATRDAIDENDRKTELTKKRDEARAQQLAAGAALGGRGGTILTSPLGSVASTGSTGGKTLLGS